MKTTMVLIGAAAVAAWCWTRASRNGEGREGVFDDRRWRSLEEMCEQATQRLQSRLSDPYQRAA